MTRRLLASAPLLAPGVLALGALPAPALRTRGTGASTMFEITHTRIR